MKALRTLAMAMLLLGIISCTGGKGKQGDTITSGYDYLCSVGIYDDSLLVDSELNFDNDGEKQRHMWLDLQQIQALQIDRMMYTDTNDTRVRVWGLREYKDCPIVLLLGEVVYGDSRHNFLATYDKDGMKDFMTLGECGGMNFSYQDEIDEHRHIVGLDSLQMQLPKEMGEKIQAVRTIWMNETPDQGKTFSPMWGIRHNMDIHMTSNGTLVVDTIYSADICLDGDTAAITPYWRNKRELEVFGWTPLSDNTFAPRLNNLLDQLKGTGTDPKLLLGDFDMLVARRFFNDTDNLMNWCYQHPESQLTRAIEQRLKEINPEYIIDILNKIKDTKVRDHFIKVVKEK